MKLGKFQSKVRRFFCESPAMGVLFLTEEVGEVAKEFKKDFKDSDSELNITAVVDEIGDVLMALTVLANSLNVSLDEVAERSLIKWKEKQGE